MNESSPYDVNKLSESKIVEEIAEAFSCISLQARLEFVANIVCAHADNTDEPSKGSTPLRVADKVLRDALLLVRSYPQVAKLDQPN
jgi:hypothetical protein